MIDHKQFILLFLELTIAGYVLFALLLLVRAFTALASQRRAVRQRTKGSVYAYRPDYKTDAVFESGIQ